MADELVYNITIQTTCGNEEVRKQVEQEVINVALGLGVEREDITRAGFDNEVEVSWDHTLPNEETLATHLVSLRSKLDKITKQHPLCFEVSLDTDSQDVFFIGLNADVHEVTYLLDQLDSLSPRLIKRSDMIAKRCNLDAVKLKNVFEILQQIPDRDTDAAPVEEEQEE